MALINCPECNSEVSDQAPQCVKCGYPIADSSTSTLPKAQQSPSQADSPPDAIEDRLPCPSCGERVSPSATVCPFCKQPILSRNKGTNAVANIVLSIIIFLVLFYALSAFTRNEADKEYKRITEQAERDTARIMRDLQNR